MNFSELNLSKNVTAGINDAGFISCTGVQERVIPLALAGHDVCVQSQTGTGKTAAFLLSLFEVMERSEYREFALIVVPTRELAAQIEKEAKLLGKYLPYNIASIYGGVRYEEQEENLRKGAEILVGTPGRLIDLQMKGALKLDKYHFAVIDEADRMFDMGFYQNIRQIFRTLPKREFRQTMLFSATMSFKCQLLAQDFMKSPENVVINPKVITVDKIEQKVFHVGSLDKFKLMMGILQKSPEKRAIVFSNTKNLCDELTARLEINGISAVQLTGDMNQHHRDKAITNFKKGGISVLVATDIAARGIHVDNLDIVINYDIPNDAENYIHRIGRTARAGKDGVAYTFACEIFVEYLAPIEKRIEKKIPSVVACVEDFGEDKSIGVPWKTEVKKRERSSRPTDNLNRERTTGEKRNRNRKPYGEKYNQIRAETSVKPEYPQEITQNNSKKKKLFGLFG